MPNAKVDKEGKIALSPQEGEEENPGKFSSFHHGTISKRSKSLIYGPKEDLSKGVCAINVI